MSDLHDRLNLILCNEQSPAVVELCKIVGELAGRVRDLETERDRRDSYESEQNEYN